jgi:dTDP-4-dehydrorhamnose reductase
MKILLLGASGQVGWELTRTLSILGDLVVTRRMLSASDGPGLSLDTTDLDALERVLDEVRPQVIVNATAYTAVDKAESEPDLAMRLNGDVPGVLGRWAAAHDALVVHYSTDYVFDGRKDGPYVETDAPNPLGVYGRTKLAGDEALLASGCRNVILRVSWVYSLRGSNFLLTMKRLMAERDSLRIVDDQVGAPTWSRTIAQVTSTVLAEWPHLSSRDDIDGVYHLAPAGHTSWFGFATAIRDRLGLACELQPIPSSEYPTAAARPANSTMDCARLGAVFGMYLPSWETELRRCLATD